MDTKDTAECYECEGDGQYVVNVEGDSVRCRSCGGLGRIAGEAAIVSLEYKIEDATDHAPEEFERDPGGNLCIAVGPGEWYEPNALEARMLTAWSKLTGETIRQQSDEPDYDAPTASETREREISTYLSLK